MNIIKVLKNKVLIYLFTRYLTYFIQFLTSVLIAVKLGPYYFGIWGFILLLINYFRIIDFGISNALNILMVQNKNDKKKIGDYVTNALFILFILGSIICFIACYYYFFGISFFDKYEIENKFYIICFIGILANFNVLMMNIYRVNNSLFHLSFYQSIIPVIVFAAIFLSTGEKLLYILLGAYMLGNILSLTNFLIGKKIPLLGKLNKEDSKKIMDKGFFLFIYNISFYLIILSIKTLISIYYSVEEFGFFAFSYTLSNSILLFLQALTFVIFPKVIDKLKNTEMSVVKNLIDDIRSSYVTMAFGLVFLALIVFPFLLKFIPKYEEAFLSLTLTSLTVVLYTNSFGYGTFLMAQNKEKLNSFISFLSLAANLIIALILILVFKVEYNYVIIATIIAYILYAYLCVYFGKKHMNLKESLISNMEDCFPMRLFLPFLLSIILIMFEYKYLLFLPFILYLFLNIKEMKNIVNKIKLLINKPDIINL